MQIFLFACVVVFALFQCCSFSFSFIVISLIQSNERTFFAAAKTMHLLSTIFLCLIFISVYSRPNNNNNDYSNDPIFNTSDGTMIHDFLSSDPKQIAEEDGNGNVKIVGNGTIQLMIPGRSLNVKVDLKHCYGSVLLCYDSLQSHPFAKQLCSNIPDTCGFTLFGDNNIIKATNTSFDKSFLDTTCPAIHMNHPQTFYCQNTVSSCNPRFDDDGKITIHVKNVSDRCPISITNVKIYHPPTLPPPLSTTANKSNEDETFSATSEWWFWVIIGIVIALILIGGGIFVFIFCWKKKQKKEEPKKKVTISDSTVSTIVTKDEALKVEKPKVTKEKVKAFVEKEKSKSAAEKLRKKYSKGKKTTKKEEIKKPKSKKEKKGRKKDTFDLTETAQTAPIGDSSIVQEQSRSQRIKSAITKLKSRSSRRSYSKYKDSLEKPVSFNQEEIFETHFASIKRHSLILNADYDHMERYYKIRASKVPSDVEVSLLCNNIGDVFVTINHLIRESQETLEQYGATFSKKGEAKKFPKTALKFVSTYSTPEYVRLTAFAAEFGHLIQLKTVNFKRFSLSLLLVIAFTLSLPEKTRRHALAVLRRKLPKCRNDSNFFFIRFAYGFPANAIELAYEKNPRSFEDVSAIKTDSTSNLSEATKSA